MPSRRAGRRSATRARCGSAGRGRPSARRAAAAAGSWTSPRASSSRRRIPPESLSTASLRRVGQPRERRAPRSTAARDVRDAVEAGEDGEVVLDGDVDVEVVELRDDAHLARGRPSPRSGSSCRARGSRRRRRSPARSAAASSSTCRRRSARAGRGRCPGGDLEVEAVDGGDLAEALDDAAKADCGHSSRSVPDHGRRPAPVPAVPCRPARHPRPSKLPASPVMEEGESPSTGAARGCCPELGGCACRSPGRGSPWQCVGARGRGRDRPRRHGHPLRELLRRVDSRCGWSGCRSTMCGCSSAPMPTPTTTAKRRRSSSARIASSDAPRHRPHDRARPRPRGVYDQRAERRSAAASPKEMVRAGRESRRGQGFGVSGPDRARPRADRRRRGRADLGTWQVVETPGHAPRTSASTTRAAAADPDLRRSPARQGLPLLRPRRRGTRSAPFSIPRPRRFPRRAPLPCRARTHVHQRRRAHRANRQSSPSGCGGRGKRSPTSPAPRLR